MKTLCQYILVSLLFFSSNLSSVLGQNLVLNPSFETNNCPTGLDEVDLVEGWYAASVLGVPDLYSTCSDINSGVTVPESWVGFQYPQTGESYAGLLAYTAQGDIREYLQNKITTPLIAGKCYEFTMSVSLMERSECAIKSLGVVFTEDKIFVDGMASLPYIADIVNHTDQYLDDTIGWTEITGFYLADGNEQYFTIGNFTPQNEVDCAGVSNNFQGETLSFYAIDDVKLRPIGPYELDFKLGEDEVICGDDEVLLTSNYYDYNAEYLWSTGDITPTAVINKSGTYWVEIDNSCVTIRDSIKVQFSEIPTANLPAELTICNTAGKTIGVAQKTDTKYVWDDGEVGSQRFIRDPGTYTLSMTNHCGTVEETVEVFEEICDCPIQFPNAFSPNGDGFNDTFKAVSVCGFDDFELQIMDRWGTKVFQTSDPNQGWYGEHLGQESAVGSYVYLLKYTDELGQKGIEKGLITLLR